MSFSFDHLLVNTAWQALTTDHAELAVSSLFARRYPADVVPISALEGLRAEALAELRELMLPDEALYVAWSEVEGEQFPDCPGIEAVADLNALQMIYPDTEDALESTAQTTAPGIELLTSVNGAEMVALTDVAFPGFFRPRTYLMGNYWGIRSDGELIAMAGERLALPGLREISAVCTHPQHTGRGHAARLIRHVLAEHAAAGLRSFLHVTDTNHRAIALYERLGFLKVGATRFTRIRRTPLSGE